MALLRSGPDIDHMSSFRSSSTCSGLRPPLERDSRREGFLHKVPNSYCPYHRAGVCCLVSLGLTTAVRGVSKRHHDRRVMPGRTPFAEASGCSPGSHEANDDAVTRLTSIAEVGGTRRG